MDTSPESREGSPPTASRGSGSATTQTSVRCTATSQARPGTVFPRIAINPAVIARYDAVSVVVQRAQSTGGIRHYDPSSYSFDIFRSRDEFVRNSIGLLLELGLNGIKALVQVPPQRSGVPHRCHEYTADDREQGQAEQQGESQGM